MDVKFPCDIHMCHMSICRVILCGPNDVCIGFGRKVLMRWINNNIMNYLAPKNGPIYHFGENMLLDES